MRICHAHACMHGLSARPGRYSACDRPVESALLRPLEWWRFAFRCVRHDLDDETKRLSWHFLQERARLQLGITPTGDLGSDLGATGSAQDS